MRVSRLHARARPPLRHRRSNFFETHLGKRKRAETIADTAVEPGEVEWQFWNAVACASSPLETLYGSDLDSLDVGSGFPLPQHAQAQAASAARAYVQHAWNVNHIGGRSLLCALGVGISGMVVPWLYVGELAAHAATHAPPPSAATRRPHPPLRARHAWLCAY